MPTAAGAWVLTGGAWKRKGRADRVSGLPAVPTYGPVSVADVNEYVSRGLGTIPSDANLVPWTWATGTDLYTVFSQLGANDILVLPEDDNPYVVKQMYRTADGTQNGANPTTDRSACRSRRGIIGLGPNAIIAPSADFPTYAAQTVPEGNREALVECWTDFSYHGNFTVKGRYIGGLAFDALKLVTCVGGTAERVKTINHYGFSGHEPGETFGIAVVGTTAAEDFTVRRCWIDGRNPDTGVRQGSGGIHLVRGGDVLIEDTFIEEVRGQGIAMYSRWGPTVVNDTAIWGIGLAGEKNRGINLEACGTNSVTLNNVEIQMKNAASGNIGPHLAVASVPPGSGSYPGGATQLYVNGFAYDTSSPIVWTGNNNPSSTVFGVYQNISVPADVHFSPSVPATYAGFQ